MCYKEIHGESYVQTWAKRAKRRLLNLTLPRKELSAFARSCQLRALYRSSASLPGQVSLSNGSDMHMFSLMPHSPVWPLAKCLEHSTERSGAFLKPAVSLKTSSYKHTTVAQALEHWGLYGEPLLGFCTGRLFL